MKSMHMKFNWCLKWGFWKVVHPVSLYEQVSFHWSCLVFYILLQNQCFGNWSWKNKGSQKRSVKVNNELEIYLYSHRSNLQSQKIHHFNLTVLTLTLPSGYHCLCFECQVGISYLFSIFPLFSSHLFLNICDEFCKTNMKVFVALGSINS